MSGRDSILEAAEEVFVEKGFAGASMSAIADEAGVAKSLIYHHFQSKDDLWKEVIQHRFSMVDLIEKLYKVISQESTGSLVDIVAGREGFFEFLKRKPGMVRMMTWLNLEGSGPAPGPKDLQQKVIGVIIRMMEEGRLRADLDPAVLPILFMSISTHWFAAKWDFREWFDSSIGEEELDRRYIEGAMDIIMRGILPDEG